MVPGPQKMGPKWAEFFGSMGDKDGDATSKQFGELFADHMGSFFTDVLGPMGYEYAVNVGMGLATMGLVRFGTTPFKEAINPVAFGKFLMTKPVAQLSVGLQQANNIAKDNPVVRAQMQQWLQRVGREGLTNTGFTVAQESLQGVAADASRSLGRQNMAVALIISAGLALAAHKGGAMRNPMKFGKGNEVHVDPHFVNDLITTCKDQGHTVRPLSDGAFEVRTV